MDSAAAPRFEAMTTGTLLDRAFRLYTSNFSLMLGIAAAAYVPFYLIMLVLEASLSGRLQSPTGLPMLLFQLVFMILWASVAFPLASGAATFAISERYLGNEVSIGDALLRGLSHFWTLSLAQITATIRVMFGFILLIIPGILWMLSYSLVVPAILVEGHKAMPGLKRSRELVKGYRGKVFLVMVVINLLQAVLAGGVGVISSFLLTADAAGTAVLSSALGNLLSILLTPLGIIAAILLYYDMRIRKEGFDLEMLSLAVSSQSPDTTTQAILSR